MKKTSPLLLVLASWMLLSCTSVLESDISIIRQEEHLTEKVLTVKATIGENPGTKTAVQSDGTSIYWTPGDAINLFYGTASAGQFTTAIESPALTTDFSGTLSVATGTSTESGVTTQNFWGVYPYNVSNTCTGDGVTLTIPSTQSGIAGSFADKLNPSVATSPGLSLAFYNVGSWFIFSVIDDDVVSAKLSGHNNEYLAGKIKVTMDPITNKPVAEVLEGQKSIIITPESETFEVGKQYYMVVIPNRMSSGLELTLTKRNGFTATWSISSDVTFTRSQFLRKLNADNGLTYEWEGDLGLSVKWASCNLGASSPEESGDYYAWGETETYYSSLYPLTWKDGKSSGFDWSSYTLCNGTEYTMTRYCKADRPYYWGSSGSPDNMLYFSQYYYEDDAARQIMGGSWRTPTSSEWNELKWNCTWTWTDDYLGSGVSGMIVKSRVEGYTDKSIFLPAAGYWVGTNLDSSEPRGYYWCSEASAANPSAAAAFSFSSSNQSSSYYRRYEGRTIRPVFD